MANDSATIGDRLKEENGMFGDIAADCSKLAVAAGECREALRKIDGGRELTKSIDSLGAVEMAARDLSRRLDRLSRQPIPLALKSMPAAGSA